eukprot:TRINITY_DN7437_c0_g1_i1.p1 TRINITY_DN7437_c0_g1~~TRINITY_DN7437_c0_g1_i1.p1  ORF type:complete len:332 (+),score=34.89 TRINITY_DN7437_c0_g1_i1:79-996(+)
MSTNKSVTHAHQKNARRVTSSTYVSFIVIRCPMMIQSFNLELLGLLVLASLGGYVAAFVWGFINIAIAEMLIHKYVYHGHWWVVRAKSIPPLDPATSPTLFTTFVHRLAMMANLVLNPFYVQHWLTHHKHARVDPKHMALHGDSSDDQKADTLSRYPSNKASLSHSSMGMSANLWGLLLQHFLLALTPHPYFALVFYNPLSSAPGSLSLFLTYWLPSLFFPMSTIYHRYLHLHRTARQQHTPWYFRFLLSAPGDHVATAHFLHHTVKDSNWNIIVWADNVTDIFGMNTRVNDRARKEMAQVGFEH